MIFSRNEIVKIVRNHSKNLLTYKKRKEMRLEHFASMGLPLVYYNHVKHINNKYKKYLLF